MGDRLFKWIVYGFGLSIIVLFILLIFELYKGSLVSIKEFGLSFIYGSDWKPNRDIYGAWPFIFGTIVSSLIALLIATPISIGIAVFLVELAPRWIRTPVGYLVELLAAIPSIVYGIWGIFVLAPFVREYVSPALINTLGRFIPYFAGPSFGVGLITASIVLAIMIIPTITAISREVINTVPDTQREASYALGATKWEMISTSVLTYARSGILGAMIIGLGRAIGETMAVTMVIGNRPIIPQTIFDPAYTMASVIANEFTEATSDLNVSALIEIGLVLFAVTLFVNMIARILVWSFTRGTQEVK
ncbi:phosphate ABC transporter permease subunit PstC [Paenibacillus tarimensis]